MLTAAQIALPPEEARVIAERRLRLPRVDLWKAADIPTLLGLLADATAEIAALRELLDEAFAYITDREGYEQKYGAPPYTLGKRMARALLTDDPGPAVREVERKVALAEATLPAFKKHLEGTMPICFVCHTSWQDYPDGILRHREGCALAPILEAEQPALDAAQARSDI